jgi:protein-L-isoaspartate(D-aspartate) O-methyltransferase
VRSGHTGALRVYQRTDEGVGHRAAFDAAPPVLAGFEAKVGFVF